MHEALPLDLTFNGTYVIRKGRKKERSSLLNKNPTFDSPPPPVIKYERQSSLESRRGLKPTLDLKRASSTFDNIKSLLKEGLIEGLNDPPPDFLPPNPPKLVRVVSLPTLPMEKQDVSDSIDLHRRNSKCERFGKINELAVTLEEAEDELSNVDNPSLPYESCVNGENELEDDRVGIAEKSIKVENTEKQVKMCNEVETQTDLSDIEMQNELESVEKQFPEISKTKSELEEVEKKIQEIVKIKTVIENQAKEEEEFSDPWVKVTDLELPKMVSVVEEKPPDDFPVNVEVLQHDFGPLPPSPVEENEDEYSDVFQPSAQSLRGKADTLPEPFYRCQEPPGSDPSGKYLNRPPEPLPHRTSDPIPINSISRSIDVGFNRVPRGYANGSRKEVRMR